MKRLLLLLVTVCILLTGCINQKIVSTNIANYTADCQSVGNASRFMPNIADLGAYAQLKYTYQVTDFCMLFRSDGLALFVKYDQENYEAQKEHVLNSYTFLESPVMSDSDTYALPLTEFEYNGCMMKIVPDDDSSFRACKSFMILGLNDDECVIAYLYFYDFDHDYIAKVDDDLNAEMIEFVDDAFSWMSF